MTRLSRWLRFLGLPVLMAVVALPACEPPPRLRDLRGVTRVGQAQRVGQLAGFSMGGHWPWLGEVAQIRDLDSIAASGAKWIRMDFHWSAIEARRGRYHFRKQDRIVELAARRGISVIAVLVYTPRWARAEACRSNMQCQPANAGDYGKFAKVVAQRYKGRVRAFELWNEPNIREFFRPKPNPAKYAAMTRSAYLNIRSVDRRNVVVAGALSPAPNLASSDRIAPITFVRRMYSNDAKGYFSAISMHPYSGDKSPLYEADWNVFSAQMPAMHSLMVAHGDGDKKVWGTEMGFVVGSQFAKGVSEATQARYLRQAYTHHVRRPWAGPLIWFLHRDMGSDRNDRLHNMGIVRADWGRKPAWFQMRRVTRIPI